MDGETVDTVLRVLKKRGIRTLDITGGAPELNPHFRRMVAGARSLGVHVIDRCNLTILEVEGQDDLASFLAANDVEIIASMPCYLVENVDAQRGAGVFDGSIRGLRKLNALGYGIEGRGPSLNLVYNPQGLSLLPPDQAALEDDYRRILGKTYGVSFTRLFVLANMPIQRFGAILLAKGTFDTYLATLRGAHRDTNLDEVMCRSLVSVDWRGYLYDCDFNQMLDLTMGSGLHLSDLLADDIANTPIRVAGHCYGCTAGQGSSCGGALVDAAE
jgi:radical SAM/Cys-rich protein